MAQKSNRKFYQKAILEYGISAQGVHWNSQYSQYKRFEVLTDFIKNDISKSSIVDVGCGMGEYYNYLMDEQIIPLKYFGIDCEIDMINISKRRFPNADFELQNIFDSSLKEADYYVCSGAMNILDKNEFYTFIDICFKKPTKGFIFNFLKNDSYNKIHVNEVLSYCKNLTNKIETQDNYLDNDFSIFLRK